MHHLMNVEEIQRRADTKPGYTPELPAAVRAAAHGRLFAVDSGNAGQDSLLDADNAEAALVEAVEWYLEEWNRPEEYLDGAGSFDSLRWARDHGWSVDPVNLTGWIDLRFHMEAACREDYSVTVRFEDGLPVRVSQRPLDPEDETRVRDEDLEDALETLTGRWYAPGVWDSANEGIAGEAVATLAAYDAQPTHRIVFTDARGHRDETLVHLTDDGEGGTAYTLAEWRSTSNADWCLAPDDQGALLWYCQGQATPGGASGDVVIEALS